MKESYEPHLTIDRIDNDGHYCKENCRWVTRKEQSRNKSDVRLFEYKGRSLPLSDWANETGIHYQTLRRRILKRNESVEEALSRGNQK